MTNGFLIVGWLLIVLFANECGAAGESNLVPYTHSQCGYSLKHPKEWEVVSGPSEEEKCKTTLRPKNFRELMADYDVDGYSLRITQESEHFLCVAAAMGFDYSGSRWIVVGPTWMPEEATILVTNAWTALRAVVTDRCYHENGNYAGLCHVYRLVAKDSDGRVFSMSGGSGTNEAFELVFRSFGFKKIE